MLKRKVCVVTGTRADYGLLYWVMREIDADSSLELQIIATGMHLSPEFGMTVEQIEADGFQVAARVEMLLSADTPTAIAKSMGLGLIGLADAFARLCPDIIVVLGDRFEILTAAQAAMVARIPVAHIHGGEATEGLIDEPIRHSLTKMSHLHFTAAEEYRRRVIQLGEQPERVYNVGAPGLDYIFKTKLLTLPELEQQLDFSFGDLCFLITYHPVTLDKGDPRVALNELLAALDEFPQARLIFTKSNADTDGRIINQVIEEYAQRNSQRAKVYTSLGQLRYLSALQYVDVVLGNSSSGLLEVPVFKKPTVDIGDRQKGRLKTSSVISCEETKKDIVEAIQHALCDDFQRTLPVTPSLYGSGNASAQIKEVLQAVELDKLIYKSFYNLKVDV